MRGGQNRLPAELKIFKGTFRPSRERGKGVKPALVLPPCPAWLSPVARTEWKRVARELHELGLLTRIDQTALAGYCENYAVLVQCTNYIRRQGGYAKYLAGQNSQTTPHLTAINKAWDKIRAFCSEFGMTPSSRGGIQVPEAHTEGDEDLD